MHDGTRLRNVPFIIAAFRIVLAPLFLFTYLLGFRFITIAFFIVAIVTDILDGHAAKKLQVISKSALEAYIDAIADFVFITTSFVAFTIKEIYPVWIPIVLIGMFLFFVFTSNSKSPVYDPIGKYYGSFLIVTIGLTILFPMVVIYNSIFFSFLVYTIVLIIYRTNFLIKFRMELNTEEGNETFKEV